MIAWFAVRTQPQAEAKASHNLERQGYAVYLPRCRRWIRHARKRQAVLRPLFPRYLFVGFDRSAVAWRPILSTLGVADLVRGADGPVPVSRTVIDALRERERNGAFDETLDALRLKPGDRVRVVGGPLEDIVGRLVQATDRQRVVILFELLSRTVRVELASAQIEAA